MNKSLICITSLYVKCCQELILIMSFLYWFKNKSKALHHTCKKEQGKEKKTKKQKKSRTKFARKSLATCQLLLECQKPLLSISKPDEVMSKDTLV